MVDSCSGFSDVERNESVVPEMSQPEGIIISVFLFYGSAFNGKVDEVVVGPVGA